MKKSIFLFFAAILCAMSANAACYLKGSFNDWSTANEMAVSGTTATCTIDLAGSTTFEFKVNNGSDWHGSSSTVKSTATTITLNGSSNAKITTTFNGTYTFSFNTSTKKLTVTYPTEDKPVEKHDITVKAKYPATWTAGKAAIHFWGNGVTGTTPAAMTKDGDWWTYTVTGVPTTSPLSVIFINGETWNGDKNQTVDITGITENTCFEVSQSGSAKGTAVKADCETGEGEVIETHDITVKAFYPAGWNAGKAAVHFWGDGVTGETPAAMTKDGDWWSYTVTGVPTTTELSVIFINGNTWNGDANQTVDITGIKESTCYQITSGSGKATAAVVDCGSTPVVAETVYTLVGSANLFGNAWDPSAGANDMEKQDDGSYKKVYSNVELTGNVEWKIAKDDNWWDGPTFNASNNTLAIAKSGIYNVTFTLSADLKTANATAELLEETNKVADCFISGNDALTGGAGWAGNEFKMEYDETTQTYSYTLTGLAAEIAYELKVVLDGIWLGYEKLQTVPTGVENKNGNIAFKLAEAGDVTVTYHATNGINLTGNFAEPAPEVPVTLYFVNAENWANVKAYVWVADGDPYKAWDDSEALTDTGNEHNGAKIYSYTFPEKYNRIIFKGDDSKQTADEVATYDATKPYYCQGVWYASLSEIPAPVETKYYLIGTFNEWTLADANYELALVDGLYKKEVTLAKDAEFKVNQGDWDASWGKDNLGGKTYAELDYTDDGNLKMKEEKTFTVIFNLADNLITFEGLTVVEDFYTIVGATAITGVNWDPANEDNKMTKDGEAYTLTKTGLQLEAGDYEYKVAKNGAWNNGQYPAEGNQKVTIAENGEYTIVYTYTVGTSLTAVATKTGEYTPAQTVYTVAGDAALCGTNWQAYDATNDMTTNGDGTYTWTKTGVTLTGNVGFKVVKNHDFGNGAYPSENWVIDIAGATGVYDVTITFKEDDKNITVVANKTGDLPTETLVYTVTVPAGTEKCYIASEMNSWAFTLMTQVDATHWTITYNNVTRAAQYKYTCGESWDYAEKTADGNDVSNRTWAASDVVAKWGAPAAPATITYVLMGVNGDWTTGIALTQNPDNADEYVLKAQVISKTNDAVKVVTLTDGTATAWCGNVDTWSNATYTADADGNIVLEDGHYNFYFKKNEDKIYIEEVYVRDVTKTYGTICLPYDSKNYEGATFFRVAGKETGKVYLESVSELEAGVPYIFEKSASASKIVVARNSAPVDAAGSANGLIGNFTDETVVPTGNYILYNNAFIPADGSNKVNAYRAYLDLDAVQGGKPNKVAGRRYIGMDVQGENETTGLGDIVAPEGQTIKAIVNGQLVIIRGGEMYNVQGQKL